MIWGLMAVVVIAVLAVVLWPLLRAPRATKDRAAYDMEVFQDQLKEVERDVARGVLTDTEAASARLEIQRRILSAGRATAEQHRTSTRGRRMALAGGVAVAVPALALGIYLYVGAPTLTENTAGHNNEDVARIVQQLADRVAADPTNVEGVSLLARSYRELARWDDAVKAYQQLIALKPDADAYANYGEVLTAAANGTITPAAHDAFMKALGLDRDEPRSRFYLGLEQAENNNPRDAIAIWRDLTASAPADAPWLAMVREQMTQVAQTAGLPPMGIAPRHPLSGAATASAAPLPAPASAAPMAPAAPGAPDTSALNGRFSPEQREMIQGMVGGLAARLEQNPNDFDGWMMLARSYTVLQKPDDAAKAYEKAIALKPGEIDPKLHLGEILLANVNADAPGPLPTRLVTLTGEILKLDPAQPNALFVAGLDRAKSGDKAAARTFWSQAQKTSDPTLRAEITRRMQALN